MSIRLQYTLSHNCTNYYVDLERSHAITTDPKPTDTFKNIGLKSVVGWLVGFVALRPKSTAMVIAGRSVHLTTLFPGQA